MHPDNVGPQFREQQLPMFMTAREIADKYAPWPGDRQEVVDLLGRTRMETDREVWSRKFREALGTDYRDYSALGTNQSLRDHIAEHGIPRPIALNLNADNVLDGMHRIAVYLHENPDQLLPVEHWPRWHYIDNSEHWP